MHHGERHRQKSSQIYFCADIPRCAIGSTTYGPAAIWPVERNGASERVELLLAGFVAASLANKNARLQWVAPELDFARPDCETFGAVALFALDTGRTF